MMSQPSQQTFKKALHNDYRSKVRETARKFDLSQSASSSSVPTFKFNNHVHTNETYSSSLSTSSDSLNSEYTVNPSPTVEKKLSNEKHISVARIEIRSPEISHRRTPPSPPKLKEGIYKFLFVFLFI